MNNISNEVEVAAKTSGRKPLYLLSKVLTGEFRVARGPIKDKQRQNLKQKKNKESGKEKEHFQKLLSRPTPRETIEFDK